MHCMAWVNCQLVWLHYEYHNCCSNQVVQQSFLEVTKWCTRQTKWCAPLQKGLYSENTGFENQLHKVSMSSFEVTVRRTIQLGAAHKTKAQSQGIFDLRHSQRQSGARTQSSQGIHVALSTTTQSSYTLDTKCTISAKNVYFNRLERRRGTEHTTKVQPALHSPSGFLLQLTKRPISIAIVPSEIQALMQVAQ